MTFPHPRAANQRFRSSKLVANSGPGSPPHLMNDGLNSVPNLEHLRVLGTGTELMPDFAGCRYGTAVDHAEVSPDSKPSAKARRVNTAIDWSEL